MKHKIKKDYIGDGVYYEWQDGGHHLTLFTHDGISTLDRIFLDPDVRKKLYEVLKAEQESKGKK